jgi:hypothetical protein
MQQSLWSRNISGTTNKVAACPSTFPPIRASLERDEGSLFLCDGAMYQARRYSIEIPVSQCRISSESSHGIGLHWDRPQHYRPRATDWRILSPYPSAPEHLANESAQTPAGVLERHLIPAQDLQEQGSSECAIQEKFPSMPSSF